MVKKVGPKKKSWYGRLSFSKRMSLWGVIFLIPWIIGILVFFLTPMVKTVGYSFFQMTVTPDGFAFDFVGFENFRYAFQVDPDFVQEIVASLNFVLLNVPIQLFVSLFVAMMLNGNFVGRGFFRLVFFIPIILATNLLTLNLTLALGGDVVAATTESLVDTTWIQDIFTGLLPSELTTVVVGYVNTIFTIITTSGIQILIFLAGLQTISPVLYEVAKIEGCTGYESFCKITLPVISPMILVCLIFSMTDAFANSGVMDTIQSVSFTYAKYGEGAAMSTVYLLVSVFVVVIVAGIVSKGVFYYDN